MVKCKVCGKEFETERQLHGHLKAHKMRMAEYYQTCYPRHDKHTGDLIKFKNKEYYFENDFNSRTNLRLWLKSQDKEVAKEYCKDLLLARKEKKDLIFAPSQVELRTLMMPAIQVYDVLFGDYNELCKEIGFIVKNEKHTNEYNFEVKHESLNSSYRIYVDTREQKPLKFNIKTEIKNLKFGDYAFSHPGVSGDCHIERKSVSDFVGTLSGGFDRFVKEIERAGEAGAYLVVLVEENLNKCRSFNHLPQVSRKIKATPEYIFHNVRYLTQAYPFIQFVFVNDRQDASRVIEKIFIGNSTHKYVDLQYCYDNKIL
jgi:hypothetical protein